ncbi:hypothetical protein SEMRO_437_G142850.1 [Seminavis robusta]|uniref:Uncharacterized protein n=1 Tax=Seminavis robusta TaxID=568900 RepID=A0A9N8HH98_9STRA|nr:hypothetical protein SEMRO_437_G142850.1 [Seminavis robusta]|eukprot:Sro437_g142850.1 n/a (152) ;mRNA; r:44789-45244
MTSWNTIAAVKASGQLRNVTAESLACIDARTGNRSSRFAGPVALERFGDNALFRVAVKNDDGTRNKMVFCLPPDSQWTAETPKKVISPNTRSKAVKSIVRLGRDNSEGFDKLTIVMPWDGEHGQSMLFANGLIFASNVVYDTTMQAERVQE